MKKATFALYILVIALLAVTTVLEKVHGTDWAQARVYGSWWFTVLWALLAVCGVAYFLRSKVVHSKAIRPATIGIHAAFILILLGAGLTHFTARQDKVHLRQGEQVAFRGLTMELKDFDVRYHTGTNTPADYRSIFTLTTRGGDTHEGTVSMNHIYTYRSMRFCQMSYDTDLQGSSLAVTIDPWGIPVTYTGYGLLFLSLIGMLFDPKGRFRALLRSPLLRQGMLVVGFAAALLATPAIPCRAARVDMNGAPAALASAQPATLPTTLPVELADSLGRLFIYYNGRISPLQTFAIDYTRKIYGRQSYHGLSAEQVVSGWMLWPDLWSSAPFIRVKGSELRKYLDDSLRQRDTSRPQRRGHYALNDFFDRGAAGGSYVLGEMVRDYYKGNHDALHSQVADLDGRIQLVLELRRGSLLQIFPHVFDADHSRTHTEAAVRAGDVLWYAPTDAPHSSIVRDETLFIKKVVRLMAEQAHRKRYDEVAEVVSKIKVYQEKHAPGLLPSHAQVWAERTLAAFPWVTVLFIANLTLGLLMLVGMLRRLASKQARLWSRLTRDLSIVHCPLSSALWAVLTFVLILRMTVTGHLPLSNGYETTLVIAWMVQLIAILAGRRVQILLLFGYLLAGFFLLVSHINQMDPAIGLLMPVLDSPWLSIHVTFMMMGYALLSLTFICGVAGLCLPRQADAMQVLSRLFLLPALTTVAIGIFVGAIWAAVSWGRYWSWDPKETWALITLMVYAIPAHTASVPALGRSRAYHIYMVAAFVAVLMTYFGVNYVLGGMHAYA